MLGCSGAGLIPGGLPARGARTLAKLTRPGGVTRLAAVSGSRSLLPPIRELALALIAALGLLSASCATETVSFEDVPPADELYAEGLQILEGWNILWVYTWVNYNKAIETFQAIIDNYPYSDYAVKAELQIADAYFSDGRWDEALSYYRDFGDLHPQNPRVPYTILRSALCHYERVRSPNRDQRPTREALAHLDKVMSTFPYTPEAEEAELLWRELRTRLGKRVMMIADFYMKRELIENPPR